MGLANFGKSELSASMVNKGMAFFLASKSLNVLELNRSVELHLLGQGLECMMKGMLMHNDYDKYAKVIKKKKRNTTYMKENLGHNLVKIYKNFTKYHNIKVKVDIESEFPKFYREHRLRYGDIADIFRDYRSFDADPWLELGKKIFNLCKTGAYGKTQL